MKPRYSHLAVVLAAALFIALVRSGAEAQVYQNIVNQRFRTVSNGPQSALIVDVNGPTDKAAIRKAVQQAYSASLQARLPALQREIAFLQQHRRIKPGQQPALVDSVIVRHNGQLPLQPAGTRATRAAPNDISFNIVTQGDGAFAAADAVDVGNLINLIKPELVTVLGAPGWSGTVTVLNKDPGLAADGSLAVSSIFGALLVINSPTDIEIWYPFNATSVYENKFLGIAQSMAQAFHGPLRIAYDPWETGMARAAAVVAARDLQTQIASLGQTVDPANLFFYTPAYDLLNQPALGNNTFTPPSLNSLPLSQEPFGGMLVPRLEMSSTAWLKCYIESNTFFVNFNAAYYATFQADPTVANDVTRLRPFAKAALPNGTVEGQDFNTWFEQQYIFDTSVTQGTKLYADVTPAPDSTTQTSGAAVFLIYYTTTATGDETNLDGVSNVVYWDSTYTNRLSLLSYEQVAITNGFGSVAPVFAGIGNPERIAMDFPVNKEYVRVYYPAGYDITANGAFNNVAGTIIGSDAGTLSATFGNTQVISTPVAQGGFGAMGAVPSDFSKTQITYTDTASGQQTITQRNVYLRPDNASTNTFGVTPIFQIVAQAPVTTLTHTFTAGAQMISLPLQPLNHDLAAVLGTDPNATLLAQYRADLAVPPNPDQYLRYPSLPVYQPGYGLWSNFTGSVVANNIVGYRTDVQQAVSVALEYGWNQIGPPYTANLDVTSDLQFQYLGGDVVDYATAIANGWIQAGILGYSTTSGYVDITNPAAGTDLTQFPTNQLTAWQGYWIRVVVTEGVTLTYNNPNYAPGSTSRAAKTRKATGRSLPLTPAHEHGGWEIPLTLRDSNGNSSAVMFGQSPRGRNAFVPALDVASPPPFINGTSLALRFPHTDWEGGRGLDYMTDIRPGGAATWDVDMQVPAGQKSYTLAWNNAALLPRGVRLTLVDTSNNTRSPMNHGSSYTFQTSQGETTRHFQIVAEANTFNHLFMTNVRAELPLSGRAIRSATITYELSGPAATSVQILLGGRVVRRLTQGRAVATGVNQEVWDLRDDQGRALPGGVYLIQVSAVTPEGDQTRGITPLLLTR